MLLRKYKTFRSLITNLKRLPALEAKVIELDKKVAPNNKSSFASQIKSTEIITHKSPDDYQNCMNSAISGNPPKPPFWLYSSWEPGTPYFDMVMDSALQAEFMYARDLISSAAFKEIPGIIVEFGVFEGQWIEQLAEAQELTSMHRDIWGFDSFEGLPDTTEHDLECWSEGQYSADYEGVKKRLKCEQRPYIHLVKGWFSESFKQPEVQSIEQIAFARVDCDLYEPAVECLEYLENRLVDGAILVFDDWTWNLDKGETKAFREWVEKGCGLQFEFLCYNCNGHLYLRVTKS